jgi:hypothetical protein
MIPEKMDAANASIFNNATTRNATGLLGVNQSAEHFMLLFEDIDQYFNHLNLSNDSDYSSYDRQLVNCSYNSSSNTSCFVHQPEPLYHRNYWALVLVLFPIFTLFGNVLVILSVYRERTLQSATNYFIVSLALADLLVAVVVMPFAVYVLVSTIRTFSLVRCHIRAIFVAHTLSSQWLSSRAQIGRVGNKHDKGSSPSDQCRHFTTCIPGGGLLLIKPTALSSNPSIVA